MRGTNLDAFATGEFVAEHLNDGQGVEDEQIQPNGVDLTISAIYRTSGIATFRSDGYEKPDRMKMIPRKDGMYHLVAGQYSVVYGEKVAIPEGYVGRVYPRSRLMRSGLHLTSALWDQGYVGVGEGLLQVPRAIQRAKFETGIPIAQMSFIKAEAAEAYDGDHHGERIKMEA